ALAFPKVPVFAFACFRLHRTWSSSYILIDTKIVWQIILGLQWPKRVSYPSG
ncbi:hypothetical protein BX666DRAFT_1860631, partial [Dichotomocladium elegans]